MARKPSANVQLKVRLKEKLRKSIEAAAKHRGVSLNAEIVERLEDSFVNRDDLFGGQDNYRLMRFLALGFEMVERQTKDSWMTDFETKEAVKSAVATFIDTFGAKDEQGAVKNVDIDIAECVRDERKRCVEIVRQFDPHHLDPLVSEIIAAIEGKDREPQPPAS